jgi:hypothetical protein
MSKATSSRQPSTPSRSQLRTTESGACHRCSRTAGFSRFSSGRFWRATSCGRRRQTAGPMDEPVAVGAGRVGSGLLEDRRVAPHVVEHAVEHQLHAASRAASAARRLDVVARAVLGRHLLVVERVVLVVGEGQADRVQVQHVGAEVLHMVQPRDRLARSPPQKSISWLHSLWLVAVARRGGRLVPVRAAPWAAGTGGAWPPGRRWARSGRPAPGRRWRHCASRARGSRWTPAAPRGRSDWRSAMVAVDGEGQGHPLVAAVAAQAPSAAAAAPARRAAAASR